LEKDLHVLILPEFLPFKEKGWGGFTWNYVKSITPYCRVTIFHSRLAGVEKGLKEHNIDQDVDLIRYFPYDAKPKGLKKSVAYAKWLNDCFKLLKDIEKVDLIHAHGAMLNGTLARKLAKRWGVPYVLTEHTGPFSKVVNNSIKKVTVKKVMENASAVLAVSHHLKQEILQHKINPKRIEVTHNPVDTGLFQLKENKLFKNIVFAGRMDENKGALRAVKAFHVLNKREKDWTCTLCGDGKEMEAVRVYISDNQLSDAVKVKGMLNESEVAIEFQKADVFISPTRYESFGLAIAEALACGLPVITTKNTAPKEYVKENMGVLVDVDDIDQLVDALKQVLLHIDSYDAEAIRANIVDQYSVSNFGQRLLSIYKSL
jgi:glycosyltransferase involved in cell wall biosynthesis